MDAQAIVSTESGPGWQGGPTRSPVVEGGQAVIEVTGARVLPSPSASSGRLCRQAITEGEPTLRPSWWLCRRAEQIVHVALTFQHGQ
jgi:hypothetical protein